MHRMQDLLFPATGNLFQNKLLILISRSYIIKKNPHNSMEKETLDYHSNLSLNSAICCLTENEIIK